MSEESDVDESNSKLSSTTGMKKRRFDITANSSCNETDIYEESAIMARSGHSYEFTHGQMDEGCDLNEESQQEGTIQFHVFKSYYKAIGPCLFWMIMLSMTTMQATRNFSDIWLAFWVSQQNNSSSNGTDFPTTTTPFPTFEPPTIGPVNSSSKLIYINGDQTDNMVHSIVDLLLPFTKDMDPTVKFYFGIFILIGLLNSIFTLARAFLFAIGGISGALKIHAALLTSILKVSFFLNHKKHL